MMSGNFMKVNRLETHDRLEHFKSDQSINIFRGAEECLKSNPDSLIMQEKSPYIYIFAHPRTADDGVTKRMLWQPRLTKPKAQTNSYLFRAKSNSDELEICWLLPPTELWDQFKEDKLMDDNMIRWFIDQFRHNRQELEKPDPDDLSDTRIKAIWNEIKRTKMQEKIKQANVAVFAP